MCPFCHLSSTPSLAEHLRVLAAEFPAIVHVATKNGTTWRSHSPHHQCVIDALANSLLASRMLGIWDFQDFPLPAPGQHQVQLELLLKRDTASTRASIERILYELYRLKTAHVWELEDHLWP